MATVIPMNGWHRQQTMRKQSEEVHPQPLLAQHHAVQLCWGQTAASAGWAGAGDIDVLANFRWSWEQVDELPSAVYPATGQPGSTVGTVGHGVLYPLSGCDAGAGKAVRPRFAGCLGLGRFTVGFGFEARHPAGAWGFGLTLQLGDPFLQAFNNRLLLGDDRNEQVAAGAVQVNSDIHAYYMT